MAKNNNYSQMTRDASTGRNIVAGEHFNECNDVFFLLLFLAAIIGTVYFASDYGAEFMDLTRAAGDVDGSTGFGAVVEIVLYCGLASIGVAIVWLLVLMMAGEFLIWLSLGLIIAFNAGTAFFLTKLLRDQGVEYFWWPAIVFGGVALLVLIYACVVRKRVKFAAVHLRVAGSAIIALPMMIVVAFVMVFVQLGWVITWVMGNVGVIYSADLIQVPDTCTIESCRVRTEATKAVGITFGMLVIFFWGAFVFQNIVHVTVAGSVASWKSKSESGGITLAAWLRATTLSLGSICFGSLMVAFLETIKQVMNFFAWASSQSGNCCASCLFCCVSCIVGCIEKALKVFNRYAFTYVGIYGYSFVSAGGHVFDLFVQRGWSAIVNDDLTGNVFTIVDFSVGAMSSLLGIEIVGNYGDRLTGITEPQVVVGFLAFLIGFAVSHIIMNVLESAVTTVFVLWAEDPQGWQIARPDHHQRLHDAWVKIYPKEYNDGHGNQPAVYHV